MQVLESAQLDLWNVFPLAYHNLSNGELLTAYLNWVYANEQELQRIIGRGATVRLLHTPTYQSLKMRDVETRRTAGVIVEELENHFGALQSMRCELELEVQRWTNKSANLVIPDTNVFLQDGKPFWHIDWSWAIGDSPKVRLVLPIIVVHELDRLKRHNATRTLARQALRWLENRLSADISLPVPVTSDVPAVTIEVDAHEFSPNSVDADGKIIHFAKQLRIVSEMKTTLTTYDLGMRFRATVAGVQAMQLSDN